MIINPDWKAFKKACLFFQPYKSRKDHVCVCVCVCVCKRDRERESMMYIRSDMNWNQHVAQIHAHMEWLVSFSLLSYKARSDGYCRRRNESVTIVQILDAFYDWLITLAKT